MQKSNVKKHPAFWLLFLSIFVALVGTAPAKCKPDILPGFKNPPVDVRLKTRAGSADANTPATLQELAETGFGAAELGINFVDPAGLGMLTTALRAGRDYGIEVDLAPGGSMPYSTPGIPEADSMQQLTSVPSAVLVSDGTLVYNDVPPRLTDAEIAPSPTLALSDWRDIPELQDAVGSAIYSATVNVPAAWLTSKSDVLLDVGNMEGAMQLFVNGMPVTNQTTPGGQWSIKSLLISGSNNLVVQLDTTLLNRYAQLANSFSPGYITLVPQSSAPSGLLGPVQLIPAAIKKVGHDPHPK